MRTCTRTRGRESRRLADENHVDQWVTRMGRVRLPASMRVFLLAGEHLNEFNRDAYDFGRSL